VTTGIGGLACDNEVMDETARVHDASGRSGCRVADHELGGSHTKTLLVWFGCATEVAASMFVGFLKEGLVELGYVDGRDIDIVGRFANNQMDRLPAVAEEVIGLKPAIIVAGAVDTSVAAKEPTSTIPIVSGALADPCIWVWWRVMRTPAVM
jgi:hypothetical protein